MEVDSTAQRLRKRKAAFICLIGGLVLNTTDLWHIGVVLTFLSLVAFIASFIE